MLRPVMGKLQNIRKCGDLASLLQPNSFTIKASFFPGLIINGGMPGISAIVQF